MKISAKYLILIIALVASILLAIHYNLPYDISENVGSFGVYLDQRTYESGYRIENCLLEYHDDSTLERSKMWFGCRFNSSNAELPVGIVTTFPFKIERTNERLCVQNLANLEKDYSIPGLVSVRVPINSSTAEGVQCFTDNSYVDDGHILVNVITDRDILRTRYQSINFPYQSFYKVSPDTLRFKMVLTTNPVPIMAKYPGAVLSLPDAIEVKLNIPLNKYEINTENSSPKPTIEIDENKGNYELNFKLNENSNNFIQIDLIDNEKRATKELVNVVILPLIFIILALPVGDFYNKLGRKKIEM